MLCIYAGILRTGLQLETQNAEVMCRAKKITQIYAKSIFNCVYMLATKRPLRANLKLFSIGSFCACHRNAKYCVIARARFIIQLVRLHFGTFYTGLHYCFANSERNEKVKTILNFFRYTKLHYTLA